MNRSCREGDCLRHQRRHNAMGAGLAGVSRVGEVGNWAMGKTLILEEMTGLDANSSVLCKKCITWIFYRCKNFIIQNHNALFEIYK